MPSGGDPLVRTGLEHQKAGRFAEAEKAYLHALAARPNHPDALHLLGVLAGQVGQYQSASERIALAISMSPDTAVYHANLAEMQRLRNLPDDAVASAKRAIALAAAPTQTSSAGASTADVFRRAGATLWACGLRDEAMRAFQHAVAADRDDPSAHLTLATALRETGRLDDAIFHARRANELNRNWPAALNTLGVALAARGSMLEAIASFNQAIRLQPDFIQAHNNLGNALFDAGDHDAAIAVFRQNLDFGPLSAEIQSNLGNVLYSLGRLDEAIAAYRKAIELKPDFFDAHGNLGVALKDQGQLDAAMESFRAAMAIRPDSAAMHGHLLYTLWFHPAFDGPAILAEHLKWAEQHTARIPRIRSHDNDRAPLRRLRVGYVSPDFRTHPIGGLLVPVLKHHDRLQVEAVCYSGVRRPDAVTQKLRSAAHLWRDTRGMSDQAMTRQIVDDRIDILVDLTLHMADNRLTVFARKPAPIQLTWLAYPGTSGMSAMDYRITDPYLDPVEIIQPDDDPLAAEMRGGRSAEPRYRPLAPQPYSEESVWLPHSFWCYQPIVPAPQANALPAIGNGFITFGCFNNFAKVSEPAIRLWARVLHAVPGSRLLLQSRPGLHLIGVRKIFADAGIGRDRVEFVDRKPADEFFRLHHRIDIALDPIPYPGHTTAMDGLWMGVPVVTLAGSTVASRGGVSLLNNVGLAELIAFSQDEYVRIAARLAGDLPRLTMLRASLRVRMEQSPLTDGKQFARDLETIYRRLWRGYCDGTMQRRRLAE